MISLLPRRARPADSCETTGPPTGSADWLRLARLARVLSWLTLAWMGIEGGAAIVAAVLAGSVALLGFGLDSGIEAMASIIVIWRFTGTRLASATSERRAQQLVAVSFFLLAPYIAVEAVRALAAGDRAETSIIGLVLTAGTAVPVPLNAGQGVRQDLADLATGAHARHSEEPVGVITLVAGELCGQLFRLAVGFGLQVLKSIGNAGAAADGQAVRVARVVAGGPDN